MWMTSHSTVSSPISRSLASPLFSKVPTLIHHNPHFKPNLGVGVGEGWPALERWSDLLYFLEHPELKLDHEV